jgi:hypothetical protein
VIELSRARGAARAASEQLGAFYAAGPVVTLGPEREDETAEERASSSEIHGEEAEARAAAEPAPTVQGEGPRDYVTAFNNRSSIRLQGRTDADFSSSYRTRNVVVRRVTDCDQCSDGKRIRVTGTLVATYRVTTRTTLPSVSDYPDLTPCQQRRVQDAVDNVLAPHEQQHVAAFRTYRGTTRRRFDLSICRSEFDSTIRSTFEAEEDARRRAAQAASDALDPFYFDVDLDCEDE